MLVGDLSLDEIRQLRRENREQLDRVFRERNPDVPFMPVHLMIEPTNTCNAKCPLCPTGARELNRPKAFLQDDTFRRFVNQAFPYAETMNLWNFGEPFLHAKAFDFIRYAADRHISVTVSTNGYVFYHQENVERLVECGLDYLIVALDGATPEVFNRYRVNVRFDRVLAGMAALRDLKLRLGVDHPVVDWQYIVMRHNVHEIDQARRMAAELGAVFSVKTVDMGMVDGLPEGITVPDDAKLSRYQRLPDGKLELRAVRQNHCYYLWHMLLLNSNGEVVPCCYDVKSELVLGNIERDTLREIWNGKRAQQLRRQLLTNRGSIRPCSVCSVDAYDILFLERPDSAELQANRGFFKAHGTRMPV